MEALLKMEKIYKEFPGVIANDNVDLSVNSGEVVALLGENGAGKSTLMKILSGAYTCDRGRIILEGKELRKYTPKQAIDYGISVIYQELNYINYMTVAENILLGNLPKKTRNKLVIDKKLMYEESKRIQKDVGIDYIDPLTPLSQLTVGEKQLVEIAKAYARNLKVLVMDEPTAALNDKECEILFKLIDRLREQGKGIIYISHKLDEILRVADKIVVMRDGKRVGGMPIQGVTKQMMINMMVGREITELYPIHEREIGETLLEVENMRGEFLKAVSFNLRRGEIIGFFGLMGAGCDEIVKSTFGAMPSEKQIKVKGKSVKINSTADAIKNNMAYVPAERKTEGLILKQTVACNTSLLLLKKFQKGFRFNKKAEIELAEKWIDALHIKTPSPLSIVEKLSGGNQQKIVLAKWMANNPDILILNEPTRGIDVGAKAEIYKMIEQFCIQGLGVIIVSSEMAEVMSVADRTYVVYDGRITGEFSKKDVTQEKIMQKAIGE